MGLWDRLFGNTKIVDEPKLKFGRYTDAYKTKTHYEAWDKALEYFDDGKIIESYHYFFFYLKDPNENNVEVIETGENLKFYIYHGSKKIKGEISDKKLKIHTKVAEIKQIHIGFLRRLLEQNYALNYCRFAIDETNHIVLEFDTYLIDGSPYKLYYAIKELANKADKLDDVLLDEFENLSPSDSGIISQIPKEIVDVKINFLKKNIKHVISRSKDKIFSSPDFTGAYGYLILDTIYKLDYLVKPEGPSMDAFERMHRKFFTKDKTSIDKKNKILIKILKTITERTDEEFAEEIYNTVSTFGITKTINQNKVSLFIKGEIPQMEWYINNGHNDFALAISGYIVGYSFFNYALPIPTRKLFALYYRVIEHDYFSDLGFNYQYTDNGIPNKKTILRKVEQIESDCKEDFPKIDILFNQLDFSSKERFANTFLIMVANLKY